MPLTALDPTWINAPAGVGPSYDSEELRRDMGFLLAGGATAGVSRTGVLDPRALTVTLSGSNVQINPGGCAVGTAKGAYLTGATATATIDALVPADATNPRRDRVVLEILDPDNGGGAGRIAQFRVITGTPSATATAGGGYPAAPASPYIDLYDIDVPRSGNGNPTVTDKRPYTATAGSPVPVRTKAERDLLPKWNGATCSRLDRGGAVEYCDGTTWLLAPPAPHIEFTTAPNAAAPDQAWGMGVFSVASAYAPDLSFVTVNATDKLQVRDAGIYSITVTVQFTAVIGGVCWLGILPDYVVPMGGGLALAAASVANVKLAAGAIIQPSLAHGSPDIGAPNFRNRTFTSRVRITRVG